MNSRLNERGASFIDVQISEAVSKCMTNKRRRFLSFFSAKKPVFTLDAAEATGH